MCLMAGNNHQCISKTMECRTTYTSQEICNLTKRLDTLYSIIISGIHHRSDDDHSIVRDDNHIACRVVWLNSKFLGSPSDLSIVY